MFSAQSVTLRRGARDVLSGITMDLVTGQMTVVVGPNGAGKSSLLRILSGSLPATSGQVLFLGRELSTWKPAALAGYRAVLSQSLDVSFPFSVREVVELALHGVPAVRRRAISSQALSDVGLSGFEDRIVQQLSGGEQQRVHLARVLSQLSARHLPQFLFLDEPTSSLDVRHQVQALQLVKRRVSDRLGAFVVLHDLNLAAALADRLLIMQDGRIAADGKPSQVMQAELLSSIYGISMSRTEIGGRAVFHPEMAGRPDASMMHAAALADVRSTVSVPAPARQR